MQTYHATSQSKILASNANIIDCNNFCLLENWGSPFGSCFEADFCAFFINNSAKKSRRSLCLKILVKTQNREEANESVEMAYSHAQPTNRELIPLSQSGTSHFALDWKKRTNALYPIHLDASRQASEAFSITPDPQPENKKINVDRPQLGLWSIWTPLPCCALTSEYLQSISFPRVIVQPMWRCETTVFLMVCNYWRCGTICNVSWWCVSPFNTFWQCVSTCNIFWQCEST